MENPRDRPAVGTLVRASAFGMRPVQVPRTTTLPHSRPPAGTAGVHQTVLATLLWTRLAADAANRKKARTDGGNRGSGGTTSIPDAVFAISEYGFPGALTCEDLLTTHPYFPSRLIVRNTAIIQHDLGDPGRVHKPPPDFTCEVPFYCPCQTRNLPSSSDWPRFPANV
jgi:hypothetical protein